MLLSRGTNSKKTYKIRYLKSIPPTKLKQSSVIFILNHIKNFIDPQKYIWLYCFRKSFRAIISVIKYTYEISVYCTILLSSDSKCNDTSYSVITPYLHHYLKFLITRNINSPLLHYVKGISRFGSVMQLFPSDIKEYFKLSLVTVVVVVFISIFYPFLSFVFRNNFM